MISSYRCDVRVLITCTYMGFARYPHVRVLIESRYGRSTTRPDEHLRRGVRRVFLLFNTLRRVNGRFSKRYGVDADGSTRKVKKRRRSERNVRGPSTAPPSAADARISGRTYGVGPGGRGSQSIKASAVRANTTVLRTRTAREVGRREILP